MASWYEKDKAVYMTQENFNMSFWKLQFWKVITEIRIIA